MINRYLLLTLFICSLDAAATSQNIQIYRWTDNNGLIHYSQFPPKGKIDSTIITMVPVKVPIPSIKKEDESKNWMVDIQKYIKKKENLRKTKANQIKTTKENKTSCLVARKNLHLYQSGRRIRRQYDEGKEFRILSENERLSRIKRVEKSIKSYC